MRRVRSVSALRLGSPSPGRAGYGPYGVRTPVRRPASLSGPAHTLLSLGLLSPANRTPAPSARLCTGVIAPPEGPATAGPAAGRRPRCWTPVLGTARSASLPSLQKLPLSAWRCCFVLAYAVWPVCGLGWS